MKLKLVKYTPIQDNPYFPYKPGSHFVLLGEVENAPGHIVLADKNGTVLWMYHDSDFTELTEDEI